MRLGYLRVHVLLRRGGWEVNQKKTYRVYKELGVLLRNKTPKRRVKAKPRDDRNEAVGPNDVWAMDFVHDQLATGRKFRVLTVVDTYSRYVPVLDPRFSYRGEDVVATLERVCGRIGYPKIIRVDQGSEFISRDMDLWAYQRGVILDISRPGYRMSLPLGFQQIDVAAKLEAAVDLFAAEPEWFLGGQSEGIEQVLEKCLVRVASSLGSK